MPSDGIHKRSGNNSSNLGAELKASVMALFKSIADVWIKLHDAVDAGGKSERRSGQWDSAVEGHECLYAMAS